MGLRASPPGIIIGRLKRMRIFLAACVGCVTLHASILPTYRMDSRAVEFFNRYVAQFEKTTVAPYNDSGKLWIDDHACCSKRGAEPGKLYVEPRENMDFSGGSIHHFSGFMRLPGVTIEDIRRIMQDYANYPKYFSPDVSKGSGIIHPDSTPADEHFTTNLTLVQATIWMSVAYDSTYDVHYLRLDPERWTSKSASVSIREWRDPKDAAGGTFPEGEDHGLLWRTNTYWLVRERDGGVDMELDSMTVSRPVPTGFAWWGTKRTRDAVTKILSDMKTALTGLHPQRMTATAAVPSPKRDSLPKRARCGRSGHPGNTR